MVDVNAGVEVESEPRYVVIPLDGGVVGSVSVGMAGGVDRISEVSLFE